MPKYKARWDYRGTYSERALDFVTRRIYELEEEVADWVNRDRPGTLVERPVRKVKAASNRQETGGQNRSQGEEEIC